MDRPQLYAKFSEMQLRDNIFVVDNFFEISRWQTEGENALDIGSGDGKFLFKHLMPKFPENFGKIVASDCSEKMLEFAKKSYHVPNVEFTKFDIGSDEIPEELENSFHHIYSFYTLHWVRRQRNAFTNIFKMLKPGGDILISFIGKSTIYDVYENMSKYKRWQQYSIKEYVSPYHSMKDPEKYLDKLLNKIGFDVKVCKLIQKSFVFPNLHVLKNTIIAINPIIPQLPKDDIDIYVDDFLAEVRNLKPVAIENVNNNTDDEAVRECHKIFVVVASKPVQ